MKTSFASAVGTLHAQEYICMLALVHTQRTALSEYSICSKGRVYLWAVPRLVWRLILLLNTKIACDDIDKFCP